MNKKGTIYKIANLVNGKVYVGQTIQNYNYRIHGHKSKLHRNKHPNQHLQNSYNKYGKKNFSFKILEKVNIDKLDKKEEEYIKKYKENDLSYNIKSGGNKIKNMAQETIDKIVKANRKKIILLNTKEVFDSIQEASEKYGVLSTGISDCCSGNRDHAGKIEKGEWMVWRYLEDYDPKEKVDFSRDTAHNKKRVICLNTKEIFNSGAEAGKEYGINPKNIQSCCRGERKSCYSENNRRLQFDYYKKDLSYELEKLEGDYKPKSVVCTTTNKKFDSIYKASKYYNIDIRRLSSCCKGRYNFAGRLKDGTKLEWSFVN